MTQFIDQIFVLGMQWLLNYVPAGARSLVSAIVCVVAVVIVFPLLFAITTWLERKGLGRIQNRFGPNRVGPWGLLQPIADAIKSLTKEDIVPIQADHVVHFLAPVLLVAAAFLAYAVLPVGRNMVLVNLDAGVLFSTASIVDRQAGYTGIWPHWFVFTPWGIVGFTLFMIAATAESNRSPFDLPEGESEIIAGYYIEYSGFKFALFFLGEYLGMFATSGMAITLFLGGWSAPLSVLTFIPSYIWFFAKLVTLICGFIWIRGTLPRLRMDQLMNLAWEFILPMALINMLVAGIWHLMPAGPLRWLVCSAIVAIPCILLGIGLKHKKKFQVRTYRYAE